MPRPPTSHLRPAPWDWFHVNAAHLHGLGNLPIDARSTWATYDVSPCTGTINWFSEFSPSGELLFNARLPARVNTHRAHRAPWAPSGEHARHG